MMIHLHERVEDVVVHELGITFVKPSLPDFAICNFVVITPQSNMLTFPIPEYHMLSA
jgi:hypothetical protein